MTVAQIPIIFRSLIILTLLEVVSNMDYHCLLSTFIHTEKTPLPESSTRFHLQAFLHSDLQDGGHGGDGSTYLVCKIMATPKFTFSILIKERQTIHILQISISYRNLPLISLFSYCFCGTTVSILSLLKLCLTS